MRLRKEAMDVLSPRDWFNVVFVELDDSVLLERFALHKMVQRRAKDAYTTKHIKVAILGRVVVNFLKTRCSFQTTTNNSAQKAYPVGH
jgi:hypothetical protein